MFSLYNLFESLGCLLFDSFYYRSYGSHAQSAHQAYDQIWFFILKVVL